MKRSPKSATELLGAAAFVALVVWLFTVFGTDEMTTRLAAAGSALGAIASAVALGAAAIAIKSLNAQHSVIAEDHARQANSRLREMYADFLGQASAMLVELQMDMVTALTPEEANRALDRATHQFNELERYDWRVQLTDRNTERRVRALVPIRNEIQSARRLIHKMILWAIESGVPLAEREDELRTLTDSMHRVAKFVAERAMEVRDSLEAELAGPAEPVEAEREAPTS